MISMKDFECPICFQIIVEPCKFPCNHILCMICTEAILDQSKKCPMCRAPIPNTFSPKIDVGFQNHAKEYFPKQFGERKKVLIKERKLQEDILKVKFVFGNTHEEIKDAKPSRSNPNISNKHRWKIYIKTLDKHDLASKYIKKVLFHLHESFAWPEVVRMGPPYEYACNGWGTFTIPITIHWRPVLGFREPTVIQHELQFTSGGAKDILLMKFDKNRVKKL